MPKIVDVDFNSVDVELFLQEMTTTQIDTVVGGCWQAKKPNPCVCVVIIQGGINNVKNTYKAPGAIEGKNVNSVNNSGKIYINGREIKSKS
ncbi:hypothetical protein WKK05_22025 [Nostoc sp. UHCC 0302]|uniref:hypothetical protein n=1 Tax=Nostoc sp. UHCC 0302 TaxID=3134896 RepID=UPI00311CC606